MYSGYQLVLAGKNINSLWTTGVELVTLQCQELKPSLQVTQESIEGAGGGYDSARSLRLKFNVVPIPFNVVPSSTTHDNRTYWQLMKVLSKKYQRITSIDGAFKRIEEPSTGLISAGFIDDLPLDVQVLSISELESDYATGSNTVTFELVAPERYEF